MNIKDVYILEEAVDDLNKGRAFYDFQDIAVGDYFWDCICCRYIAPAQRSHMDFETIKEKALNQEMLNSERVITRDYRNSRIGDFLKEMDLTEERSTGIRKMRFSMKRNGSPEPVFQTVEDLNYFLVTPYPHPETLVKEPNEQVTPQVTPYIKRHLENHLLYKENNCYFWGQQSPASGQSRCNPMERSGQIILLKNILSVFSKAVLIMVAKCDTIFTMKTKHRKILQAIFSTPTKANIKFTDIESLLVSLGGKVKEGAGSRMSVTVSGKTAFFHRPHPGKEAKKYQVENAREFLQLIGAKT